MKKILKVIIPIILVCILFIIYTHFHQTEISEEEAIRIATEKWINIEEKINTSKYYPNAVGKYPFYEKMPIYMVLTYSYTESSHWEGWVLIETHIDGFSGEIVSIATYNLPSEEVPEELKMSKQ
ncbi:hypothetical protein [Bacillus sp. FJAT-45066]|uniref:hypothetical protein n=1 Tax=Bacillus sp. FJAT-45066 TaxID=2011010 RepID=UPI000BB6D364|nr:hypothetical protein [Bacillus sp. FJAT-45066]